MLLIVYGLAQDIPKREMRAVWIATVENIDWPSTPALPVDAQQKEMTELLDLVKDYNLNTVVFQIRPAADAFYRFVIWNPGRNGLPVNRARHLIRFMIRLNLPSMNAGKEDLDIHVWLNPYRAIRDTS